MRGRIDVSDRTRRARPHLPLTDGRPGTYGRSPSLWCCRSDPNRLAWARTCQWTGGTRVDGGFARDPYVTGTPRVIRKFGSFSKKRELFPGPSRGPRNLGHSPKTERNFETIERGGRLVTGRSIGGGGRERAYRGRSGNLGDSPKKERKIRSVGASGMPVSSMPVTGAVTSARRLSVFQTGRSTVPAVNMRLSVSVNSVSTPEKRPRSPVLQ